jgi:hypothetical protein
MSTLCDVPSPPPYTHLSLTAHRQQRVGWRLSVRNRAVCPWRQPTCSLAVRSGAALLQRERERARVSDRECFAFVRVLSLVRAV